MNDAIYDPYLRQWQFTRQRDRGFHLSPVTPYETVYPRSLESDDTGASTKGGRTKKWWTRCLARDVPEMGPAMPWIDNYIGESQLLAVNTNVYDPNVGRLLDFGTTTDREGHSERSFEVAGFACGLTGSDLVLSEMSRDYRDFRGSEGVKLLVPRIGTIHGSHPHLQLHSPIRQVCFAGNPYYKDTSNSRLAIRISGHTTIYRVLYNPVPLFGQPSRLMLQRLVEAGPTPGHVSDHTDVTFNPFYDRQFGTVDQKGNWKLWDIEGAYAPSRKGSGLTLKNSTGGTLSTAEGQWDGWGRIVWGADVNTVIACDRQRAALFDIRTNVASRPSIGLSADRDRNWILDMRRSPGNGGSHDVFVLTSSDVSWMDARQPRRALLSWAHRRHRDDVSLYLELFQGGDVTTALIGSRMSFLTTSYQYSTKSGPLHRPGLLGDPCMMTPPFPYEDPSMAALSMAVLPCSIRTSDDSTGSASEYESRGMHFFVGFGVDKGLGITQRIYSNTENVGLSAARSERPLTAHNQKAPLSARLIISSDEDSDVQKTRMAPLSRQFIARGSTPSRSDKKKMSHRRINLFEVYDHAFVDGEESLRTVQEGDMENSVEGFCGKLLDILSKQAARGNLGISTLIDVLGPSLLFDRLSDLGSGVDRLLNSDLLRHSYEVKTLLPCSASNSTLLSNRPTDLSIDSLYDSLFNSRGVPLPETVPNRVRLRRERLSRLIAVEVFLARTGVNLKPSEKQLAPPRATLPTSLSLSIPTPPPQSSEDPFSSQTSNISWPELEQKNEPLQRIRAYAHVQTRISLPEGLDRVLDSWKIGEDPEEFEFFVDPEEGVPRYRRDRRKIRRDKRQNGIRSDGADIPRVAGSQPPPLGVGIMSSQAAPQSSQMTQSQTQVMSQVERGKHGGRKQKRRRTGF